MQKPTKTLKVLLADRMEIWQEKYERVGDIPPIEVEVLADDLAAVVKLYLDWASEDIYDKI